MDYVRILIGACDRKYCIVVRCAFPTLRQPALFERVAGTEGAIFAGTPVW